MSAGNSELTSKPDIDWDNVETIIEIELDMDYEEKEGPVKIPSPQPQVSQLQQPKELESVTKTDILAADTKLQLKNSSNLGASLPPEYCTIIPIEAFQNPYNTTMKPSIVNLYPEQENKNSDSLSKSCRTSKRRKITPMFYHNEYIYTYRKCINKNQ